MIEVIEDEVVAELLDRLWAEGRHGLVARIEEVEDRIAAGDPRTRGHRIAAPVLQHGFVWAVRVTDRDEDWLIAWSRTAPGTAKIHAVARTNIL